jgi:4-hydroxybenzoate polyprenyltransferase
MTKGQGGQLIDYLALMRPEHWVKHIFILPGVILAMVLHQKGPTDTATFFAGLLSACAIASANYVLNEWLDARFDQHHPLKKNRPAVRLRLSRTVVLVEYFLLLTFGLALAFRISVLFFAASVLFVLSGIIYNTPPIRTKDLAYLDVLSESFNNPIRFVLGWAMVDSSTLPPSSLLLCYWMGGAFLMGVKRLAEYRSVEATAGLEALSNYRRSFRQYTEQKLLLSSFYYALIAAFFLAVFLVKYRIEYLLAIPFFSLLFGVYLKLGLQPNSPAQAPERLFREGKLVVVVVALILVLVLLTWLDLPFLEKLADPHYIRLGPG